jgi:hypothetical protein
MASTYSDLKIELIGTGEQVGTWGNTTNTNLGTALGEAITGSADVPFSSADVTITLTDTNASQTARNLRLVCTGTSGGARNLILGSGCQIEKLYLIQNNLADAVTVKNTTGTGVAVPAGGKQFVFNDGTNVVEASSSVINLATQVTGTLPVANGGTGQTSYTNGQLLIGNTTGNTLTKATLTGTANRLTVTNGTGSITLDVDATNANTANKVVARDASGNFSAGTITASLTGNVTGNVTGNASTATALQTARTIGGVSFNGTANINLPGVNTAGNQNTSGTAAVGTAVTVTTSNTSSAFKIPFANTTVSTTGNYGLLQDSTATFTYNPNTNTVVAGTFSGALSGAATSAATWTTARTITIGATGKSVNGSGNVSWSLAEIGASTDLGGVGSYIWAWYAANGPSISGRVNSLAMGSTIAGSSIRYRNQASVTNGDVSFFSSMQVAPDTNAVFPTTGTTALSGTWRVLGGYVRGSFDPGAGPYQWGISNGSCAGTTSWYPGFWVRIS